MIDKPTTLRYRRTYNCTCKNLTVVIYMCVPTFMESRAGSVEFSRLECHRVVRTPFIGALGGAVGLFSIINSTPERKKKQHTHPTHAPQHAHAPHLHTCHTTCHAARLVPRRIDSGTLTVLAHSLGPIMHTSESTGHRSLWRRSFRTSEGKRATQATPT